MNIEKGSIVPIPCRKCGSLPIISKWTMSSYWSISCEKDGCHHSPFPDNYFKTEEDAIKAWNEENSPQICHECDSSMSILESYGVPRKRARSVHNGIMVLVSRMSKENSALQHNLIHLKKSIKEQVEEVTYPAGDLITDAPVILIEDLLEIIEEPEIRTVNLAEKIQEKAHPESKQGISKEGCLHCAFLETLGPPQSIREYWMLTEIFVHLHGGKDSCDYDGKEETDAN